jgi:hypothetical protein
VASEALRRFLGGSLATADEALAPAARGDVGG